MAPWNSIRKKGKLNLPRRTTRQKSSADFSYSKKLGKRAIRPRNFVPNIGTPPITPSCQRRMFLFLSEMVVQLKYTFTEALAAPQGNILLKKPGA
jgi:hypothetical protein